MRRFEVASRTRPPAMGGIPPINPLAIIELCRELKWPCECNEAITVLLGMDDEYRDIHKSPDP